MTKTKFQFLPLAAICRKIKHSFISFLFHVPATVKDDTVFSCDARSMGCENICDILVDIFGCHSFRLAIIAGVGHCLSKKAHSNGNDLWCNWEWIAVEMWIFVLKTVEVGLLTLNYQFVLAFCSILLDLLRKNGCNDFQNATNRLILAIA